MEIGMMPLRLTSPTVGFKPTRLLSALGQTIEPSVSVPTVSAAKFAAAATPDPELLPQGERAGS
jgi:hypothetical protein